MALSTMRREVGEDDAWVFTLRKAIREQPIPVSIHAALEPLVAHAGFDPELVEFVIEGRRKTIRAKLTYIGCAGYPEDLGLVIFSYTLEVPKFYGKVNDEMHSPDRASGPNGISPGMRACLPYIKLLDHALATLPPRFKFKGRVHRGVKYAFPSTDAHDPEGYFNPGRDFFWYEFKSSARDFDVMHNEVFCGKTGPRTIFTIEATEAYLIEDFSLYPEAEVLFRPNSHFEVVSAQKRLRAADLVDGAAGGFADEIHLKQLPTKLGGGGGGVAVGPDPEPELGPVPAGVSPPRHALRSQAPRMGT